MIRSIPWALRKLAIATAADVMYEIRPDYSWKQKLLVRFRGFVVSLLINALQLAK